MGTATAAMDMQQAYEPAFQEEYEDRIRIAARLLWESVGRPEGTGRR